MTPDTFEDLAPNIINMVPLGYTLVDLRAPTYRECSIKNPECLKRGCADKILIKSPSSRLPPNFEVLLKNGDNKKRMIEIFKEVYIAQYQCFIKALM